jgi:transcriptional regulator with XRE-family HTH domain
MERVWAISGIVGGMSVGQLIRQLRRARGWSQSRLAEELNKSAGGPTITREYISRRWESGKVSPSPFWTGHLAAVLGVTLEDLEADAVRRREFLVAAAAVAMTPHPKPSRIGAADIERLYRRTARLRRLDDIMGGADTYPIYAAGLGSTARLIRESTRDTRSLTSLLAEQAQLAGWAAFDSGEHDLARKHYESSLRAATEAEDDVLAGNALAFLAYQMTATSRDAVFLAYQMTATSRDAVVTAEASLHAARDRATPKVKALLLERLAWAYATAHRSADTAHSLAQARDALHAADGRPEPDWVFWVDEDELSIMSGRCWAQLGHPRKAIPALAPALERMSDTCARDKALYLAGLANAHVDAGDIELANLVAERAFDLAAGVASVRPVEHLRRVARRLAACGAVSEPLQIRLGAGD